MPTFLKAEWRHLVMLNYAVDPALLQRYVPAGVEVDERNGKTYISMVGFLFLRTKVCGLPIPQHTNFEEVNLRFYVKRKAPDGWRRGVVFIKEIVPRPHRSRRAQMLQRTLRSDADATRDDLQNGNVKDGSSVQYAWQFQDTWNSLRATTIGTPQLAEGSEEQFITEHYWGYTAQPNGRTKEYRVEHVPWKIWKTKGAEFNCNVAPLYGQSFVAPLSCQPLSAFIAEGSAVTVSTGTTLSN